MTEPDPLTPTGQDQLDGVLAELHDATARCAMLRAQLAATVRDRDAQQRRADDLTTELDVQGKTLTSG